MEKLPITKTGFEALEVELDQLKKVDRPAIIEQIADAREHGDLKENAEYHSAREKQGFIEGRIAEIEGVIAHAEIIDVSAMSNTDRVVFGTTVTLLNIDTNKEVIYQIVGEAESDLENGKIALTTPIARGLIGKEVEDDVTINTPNGAHEYEILDIKFV